MPGYYAVITLKFSHQKCGVLYMIFMEFAWIELAWIELRVDSLPRSRRPCLFWSWWVVAWQHRNTFHAVRKATSSRNARPASHKLPGQHSVAPRYSIRLSIRNCSNPFHNRLYARCIWAKKYEFLGFLDGKWISEFYVFCICRGIKFLDL